MLVRNKTINSIERMEGVPKVSPDDSQLIRTRSNRYPELDGGHFYSRKVSIKEEMQCVTSYFSEFKPTQIVTPFQGASLLISQNRTKFYFCSKEGRIAIARIENKEILQVIDLKEGPIRTIALYQNDKYLFSGGHGGTIKKFLLEDLTEVDTLFGHSSEIEALAITADESFMYSIEVEGTVMKWNLTIPSPSPTTLYSHSIQGCGLDLSTDNSYLATCGGDKCVTVFNISSMNVMQNIQDKEFGVIWCVKITEKNGHVAFGDDLGKVYLYKFETWEKLKVFHGHSDKVRCMIEGIGERSIITGGSDLKIIIWDIVESRERLVLKGHKDGVKSLMISRNKGCLFSMSDDSTIRTWKLPNFNHYYTIKLKTPIAALERMQMGRKKSNMIYVLTRARLLAYDRLLGTETTIENLVDTNLITYCFCQNNDIVCLISTAGVLKEKTGKHAQSLDLYNIRIYDYHDKIDLKQFDIESYGVYSVLFSLDQKYLMIGEIHHCRIYLIETFELYHIFRCHKYEITSLAISPNGSTLYSGDKFGIIKSYDFLGKYEIKTLNSHESKVSKMLVTDDSQYMIAVHEDFVTNIWASSKMIKINTIVLEKLEDLRLPSGFSVILALYKTCIKCFIIPSLMQTFTLSLDFEAIKFSLSVDERDIAIYRGDHIAIYGNPLKCQEIKAFGDLQNLNYFHEQVGKLISGKYEKHDSKLNEWVIQPFNISIMHIYAYLDKYKFLRQCFEENVGFFISRGGYTPLDICLNSDFEKCLDILYSEINKLSKKSPLFLKMLEGSLVRINKSSHPRIHKFYQFAIFKTIDTRLPKFCNAKHKLPLVVLTDTTLAHKSAFMDGELYSNEGIGISFKQTYFRIHMVPGSLQSIKLINSIISCSNEQILTTEFINQILEEKWKKVRITLYLQGVLYLAYLTTLSVYAVETGSSIIASFVLSDVLIFYEIWQLICSGMDYFKDMWNFIDITRSALMTLLFFQNIFQLFDGGYLLAFVLFFSWLRGLSYFRLLKVTRYYVNLIYEVFFDIIPFLTILFYSTLAFSFIFRTLMNDDDTEYAYLTTAWEINVGGFDTSGYGKLMYLAFFLHTVLNPILMLNLLIGIMSNSFKKVNKQTIIADNKELANMILEGELFYFWNRAKKEKLYMHICFSNKSNLKS